MKYFVTGLTIDDYIVDAHDWEYSCDTSVDGALAFSNHLHLLFSACSASDLLILLVVDVVKSVSKLGYNQAGLKRYQTLKIVLHRQIIVDCCPEARRDREQRRKIHRCAKPD